MAASGYNDTITHFLLDSVLGDDHSAPGIGATVYAAPTKEPSHDAGTGVISAVEYTDQPRTAMPNNNAHFPPAANREKSLVVEVNGGEIGTAWDTAAEWICLYAAVDSPAPFWAGRLATAKTGATGSTLVYKPGVIKIVSPIGA